MHVFYIFLPFKVSVIHLIASVLAHALAMNKVKTHLVDVLFLHHHVTLLSNLSCVFAVHCFLCVPYYNRLWTFTNNKVCESCLTTFGKERQLVTDCQLKSLEGN